MSNKKGISDVVTTVLIVLLSLVAVAIVWSFLSPLITKSGTQIAQTQACLSASLEVSGCNLDTADTIWNYSVTVKRNAGTANITSIKLIFGKTDGSTVVKEQPSAPEELGTNLYSGVVVGSNAKEVSVAAGIKDAKGAVGYCTPSQPTICSQ
jgi:hypothetical protein